jgi:hypothetical protein
MVKNSPAASTLNNAVLFRTSQLDVKGKHFDVNTVESMFGKGATTSTYLGLMKLWDDKQMLRAPLLSDTVLKNNVMYIDTPGQLLGYSRPHQLSAPFVKENMVSGVQRPGYGGVAVPLVLSTNDFTGGDVITSDFRNGVQLRIELDDNGPRPSIGSDGWVYQVKLYGRDVEDKWIPQKAFSPGTPYYKIGHYSGEYGTNRSGMGSDGVGLAHYAFETSNADMGVKTWITRDAGRLKPNSVNGKLENLAFWGDITDMNAIMNLIPPKTDKNGKMTMENGQPMYDYTQFNWIPFAFYKLQMELARMQQRHLMWAKGGTFSDGVNKVKSGVGYWWQLKSGNSVKYRDPRELLSIIKNLLGELFYGSKILPQDRVVRLKMGTGAMIDIQKEFQQDFKLQNPFLVKADDIPGLITGDNMNLKYGGYRFTQINYPEVGTVIVEHDPSLDFVDDGSGRVDQSSIVGAFENSSYTIIIEDLTAESLSNRSKTEANFKYTTETAFNNDSNLVMLKPRAYADGPDVSFQIGTGSPEELKAYAGYNGGKVVSSDKKGFGIIMDDYADIWLKDPTRTVIIEREDPLNEFYPFPI